MTVPRDLTQVPDRTPPQNVELEMCVLGGIMLEPREAYEIVADYLREDDFYLDGHALVFRLMGELHARGIPPDAIAVIDCARAHKVLEKAGGTAVIMGMLNSVPTAANVEHHAKLVVDKAQQRRLLHVATKLIDQVYRQELTAAELLDLADSMFTSVQTGRSSETTTQHIGAVLQLVMAEMAERDKYVQEQIKQGKAPEACLPGILTGLPTLDRWTGGMKPAEMWTFGALPSVGKSALGLNILENASLQGIPVGLISLEMSDVNLGYRRLASGTHRASGMGHTVSVPRLMAVNDMVYSDWRLLEQAYQAAVDTPLYIATPNTFTLPCIKREMRLMVRRHGARVIAVDYLQLMNASDQEAPARHLEVSKITRTLHGMSRELGITVILLSQFNRRDPHRTAKGYPEPTMDWLAESGSIGNDSDVVVFIHRDHDTWDEKAQRDGSFAPPTAKLIVAKNRNAKTGRIPVLFNAEAMRFVQPAGRSR
jgi:replicative DNA helicase